MGITERDETLTRIKRVEIPPAMLVSILETKEFVLKTSGIPIGAQYRGIVIDSHSGVINMFISHGSFEEVPNGAEPEHLPVKISIVERITEG